MGNGRSNFSRFVLLFQILPSISSLLVLPKESVFSSQKEQYHGSRRDLINSIIVATTTGAVTTFVSSTKDIANAIETTPSGNVIPSSMYPGTTVPYQPWVEEANESDSSTSSSSSPIVISTALGQSRILAKELSGLTNGNSFFGSKDKDTFYASYLSGEWNVTSTLTRKSYPYGKLYAYSSSLVEGSPRNRYEKVGDSTTYRLRYLSLLSSDNSSKGSKVIADRSFNARSINEAYQQLIPIKEIQWDPSKDPTKMTIQFETLGKDMQPLGRRRAESNFNSRQTSSKDDGTAFCAAERSRTVSIGPGDVYVSDVETVTEFQPVDHDHVKAICRIAVFLTPNPNSKEGILWQEVGGKSVAFFDYELDMQRIV